MTTKALTQQQQHDNTATTRRRRKRKGLHARAGVFFVPLLCPDANVGVRLTEAHEASMMKRGMEGRGFGVTQCSPPLPASMSDVGWNERINRRRYCPTKL